MDSWRWQDLAEDEALQLDMTDGGFNWTPGELRDIVKAVNLSLSLNIIITDTNIDHLVHTSELD